MAKYRMHSIEKVEIGDCGADGAMGASLTEVAAFVPDSVLFDDSEPEITEIFIEGTDEPDIQDITKGGLKEAIYQTRDLSTDNLELYKGGSTTLGVWSAPIKSVKKFQSVQLTGKYVEGERCVIKIPKVLVTSKLNGALKKSDSGILEVKLKVATPIDAAGAPLSPYSYEYETEV